MSFVRWMPMLGLFAMLALVPSALGHGCLGDSEEPQSDGFTTLAVGAPPSPLAMIAYILIPVVGVLASVAIAVPSMRKS